MDEFAGKTLEGEWWLPGKSQRKFKGVLVIDATNQGTLTLRGKARFLATLPESLFTLLGGFRDNYSYQVTLFDVGVTRRPTPSGEKNESGVAKLFTNIIVIGSHLRSDNRSTVVGAQCSLSGLREWSDSSGVTGEIERSTSGEIKTAVVTHQAAATPFFGIGEGKELRLSSRYSGPVVFPGLKTLTIEESDVIELRFKKAISIKKLLAELLVWQCFITFATRRPSSIVELRFRQSDDKATAFSKLILVPVQKPQNVSLRSARSSALFLRSTFGADLTARMRSWAKAYSTLEKAILLFCGSAHQEGAFVHTTLLAYLQALEVFHRERFPDAEKFPDKQTRKATLKALRNAIPKNLDKKLRGELSEGLGYFGSLTLLDRLTELYATYKVSVGPLFPDEVKDLKLLRDVRNFLTHFGDKKTIQKDFLTSRRMVVLREKTRFFIEACMLSAIGVNDGDIRRLFDQSSTYYHWKNEAH